VPMSVDDAEDTRLIDIANLRDEDEEDDLSEETVFAQDPTTAMAAPQEVTPGPVAASVASTRGTIRAPAEAAGATRIATISERAVAMLIDTGVLWCLYWLTVQGYHHFRAGHWGGPAPTQLDMEGLLFHGGYVFLVFFYFFIGEGVFSRTIGKLCCRMDVRQTNGRVPSLGGVFLRNLFRPIDLLCFPALLSMEWTARHQRVGDLIAGTTVVKRQRVNTTATAIAWEDLASTTGRLLTEAVNAALFLALLVALFLTLSNARPFMSQWIVIAGPLVVGLGWSTLQVMTRASPGGWLFGYSIMQENGQPLGMSHALIRTLCIPLDLVFGPFAVILSPRRQRIGDMMGGTLVVQGNRTGRGLLGLVIPLLVILALAVVGLRNPDPWLNPKLAWSRPTTWLNASFVPTFLPRTSFAVDFPTPGSKTLPFRLRNFRFAEGSPSNTRSPATYIPGERAFFIFDVDGIAKRNGKVWIQQDLGVQLPNGNYALRQENIIDYQQVERSTGPLVLRNQVNLPKELPNGRFTLMITLRDKYAGGRPLVHRETFFVKAGLEPFGDQ
jgi:uncharacterized RDD family membrane protein YckC